MDLPGNRNGTLFRHLVSRSEKTGRFLLFLWPAGTGEWNRTERKPTLFTDTNCPGAVGLAAQHAILVVKPSFGLSGGVSFEVLAGMVKGPGSVVEAMTRSGANRYSLRTVLLTA